MCIHGDNVDKHTCVCMMMMLNGISVYVMIVMMMMVHDICVIYDVSV